MSTDHVERIFSPGIPHSLFALSFPLCIEVLHVILHTQAASQTGISGSVKIGKNCLVGGQVGFAGHITVGDNVKIGAQSGILSNLKDGSEVLGSPAFDLAKYKRTYIYFRNLEKIVARIDKLEAIAKRD